MVFVKGVEDKLKKEKRNNGCWQSQNMPKDYMMIWTRQNFWKK